MAFGTLLLFLLVPLSWQARPAPDSVEMLIPKGMPIKIEAERDLSEHQIVKYAIRRIVPKEVRRAKITTVMVDGSGMIQFLRPMVVDNLSEPASIATGDRSITRILFVVEWVEGDRGRWVLDSKTQDLDIKFLVRQGTKVLPGSKFIAKK